MVLMRSAPSGVLKHLLLRTVGRPCVTSSSRHAFNSRCIHFSTMSAAPHVGSGITKHSGRRHWHVKHVVFDMDGTLTHTGAIDFAAMRRRCGVPAGVDILAHVEAQPEPLKAEYYAIVEEEERLGLARMRLRDECKVLFDELKRRGIRRGLITRNNDAAMKQTLVLLEDEGAFDVMLSRSFTPPKPHPAPLLHIAERWGVDPAEMAMVGDSLDDVACGVSAGALAVLIGEAGDATFEEARPHAHATIKDLTQLLAVIDGHRLNHHEEAEEEAGGRAADGASIGVVLPLSAAAAEAKVAAEDAAAPLVQRESA